jgi:peroxiredoxin
MQLLVTLWRSGCAGCAEQLTQLAAARPEPAAQPLEVLALSVDAPEARAAAQAVLDGVAWPHGAGFSGTELTRALDLLQRSLRGRALGLQLPASFLVDRSGGLAVVTTGLLEPEQLARDLELLDLPAHGRLESAAAFPGRWLGPAPSVDFTGLESTFRAAGLTEVADAVARARLAASAARPVKRR